MMLILQIFILSLLTWYNYACYHLFLIHSNIILPCNFLIDKHFPKKLGQRDGLETVKPGKKWIRTPLRNSSASQPRAVNVMISLVFQKLWPGANQLDTYDVLARPHAASHDVSDPLVHREFLTGTVGNVRVAVVRVGIPLRQN